MNKQTPKVAQFRRSAWPKLAGPIEYGWLIIAIEYQPSLEFSLIGFFNQGSVSSEISGIRESLDDGPPMTPFGQEW